MGEARKYFLWGSRKKFWRVEWGDGEIDFLTEVGAKTSTFARS